MYDHYNHLNVLTSTNSAAWSFCATLKIGNNLIKLHRSCSYARIELTENRYAYTCAHNFNIC